MQIGQNVLTHLAHGVMTVTLNRPQVVNAIDEITRSDLRNVFGQIRLDPDIRAVILTGAGENFCAGGDIGSMEDMTEAAALEEMNDIRDTALAIAGCDKPVIAAIEGHAASAGIGLALLCDIVIASRSSRFTFSFSRIGLGPDWGLSVTLPDRVGRNWARKLIWEARKLDTQTCYEINLIDEICLPGGAVAVAWDKATRLADKATLSVQGAKRQYRLPLGPLGEALAAESASQTECYMSEDFIEGLNAFRSKRKPEYSR